MLLDKHKVLYKKQLLDKRQILTQKTILIRPLPTPGQVRNRNFPVRVSSFPIFDDASRRRGAKRRAYATSTPITRDHPLQEITHYKSFFTLKKGLQLLVRQKSILDAWRPMSRTF